MIVIKIPNNNVEERTYILNVFFNEFLDLKYALELGSNEYEIVLENGQVLRIEDKFFNKYPNDLEYLKLENIPSKLEELDLFSASFFMLTRWEEYVNKKRDSHNRFSAIESLAFKEGFLDRPVVNEYLEVLKTELLELDASLVFKKYEYSLLVTHDIDAPLMYGSFKNHCKASILDILQRKDVRLLIKRNIGYFKIKILKREDPFNTFDYLMNLSEKYQLKSYFFFMGKGLTGYDNMYKSSDRFIGRLVEKIKARGHYIGIHPTYDAYNSVEQFKKEKDELERTLNTKITFGREHYLRFEVPRTWQVWEENKMKWESTLSYADKEGFRCGICYPYSVFNILTRNKLKLKERPLIVMEGSFATYQKDINPKEMEDKIFYLIKSVKKYNGEFVLLWHNSSFNTNEWKKYEYIYERVLSR